MHIHPSLPEMPPLTPDNRYIVVRGRLWRAANPHLPDAEREQLVKALMAARRAVGAARMSVDKTAEDGAHRDVNEAKIALGERGCLSGMISSLLGQPPCPARHDVDEFLKRRHELIEIGEPRIEAALALYVRRIVREVGALAAVLGGLDMLVFTAGIGEHNVAIRERVCAGLAYLGIGVTSGISWGQTINNAVPHFETYPLYLWEPVVGIVALVLALNLLGDAVRDALDPKTRR